MNEEKLVQCERHELMKCWGVKPRYKIVCQFYDILLECYFLAEKYLFDADKYKGKARIKYFRDEVRDFIDGMADWFNVYVPFEEKTLTFDRLNLKSYVELGDDGKPLCFVAYGAEETAEEFQENYMEYNEFKNCYEGFYPDPFKEY